jgi:hypothetical protein
MVGNELNSTGVHHAAQLKAGEPSQPHDHRTAIVKPLGVCRSDGNGPYLIVLVTLTVAALEIY